MQEANELHACAAERAAHGDVVSAIVIDALAIALERGKTWPELLDDIQVRVPYLN